MRSGKCYLASHPSWDNPDADTSCPLYSEAPQPFAHAILSCFATIIGRVGGTDYGFLLLLIVSLIFAFVLAISLKMHVISCIVETSTYDLKKKEKKKKRKKEKKKKRKKEKKKKNGHSSPSSSHNHLSNTLLMYWGMGQAH